MLFMRIARPLLLSNLAFKSSHVKRVSTNIDNMASYIERCQQLQQIKLSDDLCKEKLQSANYMLFSNGKALLKIVDEDHSILWTNYNDVRSFFIDDEDFLSRLTLLDIDDKDFKGQFAISLPDKPESIVEKVEEKYAGKFFQQRAAYFTLPHAQSAIICQGTGILAWNKNFKFCPNCGNKLISYISGWQKKCDNCQKVHYPQTSPVIITLVVNESNTKCVLVRQHGHYKGMYTAVAGFIEVGETVEDAVKREVAEEIGLEIKSLRYLKSQYWFGPNSNLMLGFFAIAKNTDIAMDKIELQDAKWFSIEEVKEAVKNTLECKDFKTFITNSDGKIMVPPKPAIAQDLIMEFLNQC